MRGGYIIWHAEKMEDVNQIHVLVLVAHVVVVVAVVVVVMVDAKAVVQITVLHRALILDDLMDQAGNGVET